MLSPTISIFGGSFMGWVAITTCSIPLESSHQAGSNGIEHPAIAPNSKACAPPMFSPTISIFGGSSMGFGIITAWSIPLGLSHRAGTSGIDHVVIPPKLKNPSSINPFLHYFHIWR
jgi:hypothetical protein